MTRSTSRSPAPFFVAMGLIGAAAAASPAAVRAAGFGQPVIVSADADNAGAISVAVAPNGRTAVMYLGSETVATKAGRRTVERTRVAMGPSPERLRPAVTVPAAGSGESHLFARPDGSFVACWADEAPRRTTVEGCRIAPPGAGFGALKVIRRLPAGSEPSMEPLMRPDGSIVFVLSHRRRDSELYPYVDSIAILGADGRLSPERAAVLDDASAYGTARVVVADDGTLALPTSVDGHPGVRLMLPGQTTFGPPQALSPDRAAGLLSLTGGSTIALRYSVATTADPKGPTEQRVVVRLADGTFSPPLALPGADGGSTTGPAILLPPGEGPFALIPRAERDTETTGCLDPRTGEIVAGPLGPPGAAPTPTPLSIPGLIATDPRAVVLADGTVVASWENGTGNRGTRVEVALRAPGATAFSAPQPLPRLSSRFYPESTLVASGRRAVLAWTHTPPGSSRNRVVVSSLRASPPYAKPAPRPAQPERGCP